MAADRTDQLSAQETERQPRFSPRADGDAWAIISYLLGGPIVWGGAGLLLDSWLDTGFFLPVGLLVGMAAALYIVWIRYGKAGS